MVVLLFASLTLNGAAYAVEFYLRRITHEEFYDQARQGGFAELIDICGYLRRNTPLDTRIWLNRGASRRIVALMSDRLVFPVFPQVGLKNPQDTGQFSK